MSAADSPEANEPLFVDHRSREAQRYDAICDQVMESSAEVQQLSVLCRELIVTIPKQGTLPEIHYKSEGMGIVGVICATICVMTLVLFLILGAILVVPEIHDLRAWLDINRAKIAKLEAMQQTQHGTQPK